MVFDHTWGGPLYTLYTVFFAKKEIPQVSRRTSEYTEPPSIIPFWKSLCKLVNLGGVIDLN